MEDCPSRCLASLLRTKAIFPSLENTTVCSDVLRAVFPAFLALVMATHTQVIGFRNIYIICKFLFSLFDFIFPFAKCENNIPFRCEKVLHFLDETAVCDHKHMLGLGRWLEVHRRMVVIGNKTLVG